MPSVLLFIYFCFVLLKDVKKGIIQIVVILQIFIYLTLWNTSLRLIYPTSVVAICIFVYRKCRKRRLVIYRSKKGKYPISLILISVLTSISYLISNYLALYPPDNMLTFANIYFFFILPVFLWYSLDSRKYMIYCLQLLSGCMLFACVYSIIEVLFNKNIIQDVLLSLFDVHGYIAQGAERYGFKRSNSIFSYYQPFALYCCMCFYLYFFCSRYYNYPLNKNKVTKLLYFLPLCTILTGTRAGYVAILIGILPYLLSVNIFRYKVFYRIVGVFLVSCLFFWKFYFTLIYSTLFANKMDVGSSSGMRLEQWGSILWAFEQNELWGNGSSYLWNVATQNNYEILGAENIWFSLLIDYGIMGGLMFIFLVLVCCFLIYKCQKTAVLFPVIYFVFLSLSAPIDENINILMTFVVIFLRMDYWSRDSELKWCNIVISSTHR